MHLRFGRIGVARGLNQGRQAPGPIDRPSEPIARAERHDRRRIRQHGRCGDKGKQPKRAR